MSGEARRKAGERREERKGETRVEKEEAEGERGNCRKEKEERRGEVKEEEERVGRRKKR